MYVDLQRIRKAPGFSLKYLFIHYLKKKKMNVDLQRIHKALGLSP